MFELQIKESRTRVQWRQREFLFKIRTLQIDAHKQKMSHETLTRTRDAGHGTRSTFN